jgi:hypothetical protein
MGRNKHVDLFKDMIPAVDMGMKELWDAVSDEGRKEIKGDLWNLNRYISNVKSNNSELQEHYLMTVNEFYNKNWADISKHPKLQWLTLAMCSHENKNYAVLAKKDSKLLWMLLCMCCHESKKTQFHEWIKLERKSEGSSKKARFLMIMNPTMKVDDVEVLAKLMTDKEVKELARDNGLDERAIKDLL